MRTFTPASILRRLLWLWLLPWPGFISAQNFTSELGTFSIVVENNMTFNGGDIDGPVAVGGNLTLDGTGQMASQNVGNYYVTGVTHPIGLLVNGRMYYTSGGSTNLLQGNIGPLGTQAPAGVKLGSLTGTTVYSTQNNTNVNTQLTPGSYNGNPRLTLAWSQPANTVAFTPGSLINFGTLFTTFRSRAAAVAQCSNTVSLTNANGNPVSISSIPANAQVYLSGLVAGNNILNITGANLNNIQTFVFQGNNTPNSSKFLIINVDAAGTYNWNNFNFSGIGSQNAPYILINFYNATTVNINQPQMVTATVWAPDAYVFKNMSNNIEGQVVAKSFRMIGGEVHYYPYVGTIPACAIPCTANANAGNDKNLVCSTGSVTLDGSSTTTNAQYSWTGPNGFTSASATPTVTATGTYTLTVTNPSGNCTAQDQVVVSAAQCSSLGNYVWIDADEDGFQDNGEAFVSGVTVYLYADANGDCVPDGAAIKQTTTNPNGVYQFLNLDAGKYIIGFVPPLGYSITTPDQGLSDAHDSDPDVQSGRTSCITLAAGVNDMNWDMGLVAPCVTSNTVVATTAATIQEADDYFEFMHFTAEGRIGGVTSYEMDIHRNTPFVVFNQAEATWPNGTAVPFSVVYNPSLSGSDKFIFTLNFPGSTKVLKLDPLNPPSGEPFVLNFDGMWIWSRALNGQSASLSLTNIVLNGTSVPNTGVGSNATPDFANLILRGDDLYNGFTMTGNATMAWSAAMPTQSKLNFGIKLGKLKECFTCAPTSGGNIAGDEFACDAYDPAAITSATVPGASGYSYKWLYSLDENLPYTQWVEIAGATSATYDPDLIEETTYYVRLAYTTGCNGAAYTASNVVAKEVRPVPDASFTTSGSDCAGTAITFTAANAGAGATYAWTFPQGSPSSATGSPVQVTWNSLGMYQVTLQVTVDGCADTYVSNVMMDDCANCVNLPGGGAITGGDASCIVPFDPAPIGGLLPANYPTAVEYMWLYTTDPTIPQNMWTPIPNTNAPFYDPGPLTESTWFVRCVRAIGCVKFLESNHILIEVVENAEGFCQPGSVGGFSLELPSLIEGTTTGRYILSPDDRKFITYADGTAKLEGLFIHTQNSNQRWEASIRLVQKEDWGQWSATGGTYQGGVANALHPTWDYYEIDPANSTLTGKQKFKNKVLNLQPLSATSGFQVGHGANTQDGGRGFFSGFSYTGSYTGTGTMRASLTDCQDVCSPAPLLAGRVLLEGAYDPADGGMETTLASQNQLPLNQPFNVAPWFYTGSESVTVMPDSIVDWVLIEVRDHVDPSVVEGRFAALLTEHGEVRALDGYSLADLGLEAGQYYISVQSPNHLGIMSDVTVNQYGRVLLYDFTAPDAVYEETCIPGTAAEELEPGVFGMIQGDVDGNGVINSVDIQIIINNQTVSGNVRTDLNGDGITDASDLQQALLRYFRRTHIPQN